MFKNYLNTIFRNLIRNKIFSFINILGLAIGMACTILILLWVQDELSYDMFNKNADRIYRTALSGRINNKDFNAATSPAPMGETLQKDFPEVESYTRIAAFAGEHVIQYENKIFNEKHLISVDSSFFKVFTTEFIKGNPATALTQPNTVVLTESTSNKYFSGENPIGKILNIERKYNYVVTGVIKDFPGESHFHFDFLRSLSSLQDSRDPSWLDCKFHTYLLLKRGTDPVEFQKKLNIEMRKFVGPQVKANSGISLEQFEAAGNRYGYLLQPLKSIHLYSHKESEIEPNGNITYVYIFSAIALAILLIACINFINLSTARSERRAKEVGIRKTLGSYKTQVAGQFILESVLTSSIAVLFSIGLVELLLPLFNNIADKKIIFNPVGNIYNPLFIILLAIIIGLMAGSYPAFYLSSFLPVHVFSRNVKKGSRRAILRSGLVIFQFSVSILLVISTLVIYNQLKFIQEKDLGFNKEQVIIIDNTWDIGKKIDSFEHDVLNNSNVISLSNSGAIPGDQQGVSLSSFKLKGASSFQFENLNYIYCDFNFQKTYKMKMVAGRYFSNAHPSDSTAVVINESAAKKFGIKKLEGKYLTNLSNKPNWQIIGIIKDFNFSSLHNEVFPLVIFHYKSQGNGQYLSIRIKPRDYRGTISFLERCWGKYAGDENLDYSFLDQDLQNLYLLDQRTGNIATTFSILVIFVACLGLLGLAAFSMEQRIKEIGIRKVLGASIPEIVFLLSNEYTKLVLISNLVAWPTAYYFMNKWLQNFAYRIDISWWMFVLAGGIALLIALATVSFQAIKAATANPVKSLRYE